MKKIIIIDDDIMSLESLDRLITEWDFVTETYSRENDVSQQEIISSYYCAIVDYKLPNTNGIKVLDAFKKKDNKIIPILISGFEIDQELLKEIEAKYIYFLKKPIDIQLLKKIINPKMEKK